VHASNVYQLERRFKKIVMGTSKIALLQTSIFWKDQVRNIERANQLLEKYSKGCDVVVFPEMFASGFSVQNPSDSAKHAPSTLEWMKGRALRFDCAVVGTVIVSTPKGYVNRMYFVTPNEVFFYDKRHLFSLSSEGKHFVAGKNFITVKWRGFTYGLQICYDLRFPVFSRNTHNYDVLLYSANWPAPRIKAWDALLAARAIENVCYCAGVNRVGEDGQGYNHPGHSAVYSYTGDCMDSAKENKEDVIIVDVSKEELDQYRDRFPFLKDADEFSIT